MRRFGLLGFLRRLAGCWLAIYTRQRSQRGQNHRGPIVQSSLPLRFTCEVGQQFHGDRAFYYKGPWLVFYRGREVGRAEIMCFNKRQVAA